MFLGFLGSSAGKESACNVGDLGSIPALGRGKAGEGKGYPLQYSCLENPMDRGAWWATVHGVTKSRTWLKWLSTHECTWQVSLWRGKHFISHSITLTITAYSVGLSAHRDQDPLMLGPDGVSGKALVIQSQQLYKADWGTDWSAQWPQWELVLLALDNQYPKDLAFCFHYYLLGYS